MHSWCRQMQLYTSILPACESTPTPSELHLLVNSPLNSASTSPNENHTSCWILRSNSMQCLERCASRELINTDASSINTPEWKKWCQLSVAITRHPRLCHGPMSINIGNVLAIANTVLLFSVNRWHWQDNAHLVLGVFHLIVFPLLFFHFLWIYC